MDNQRRDRGRYGGGRFDDNNAPKKPEPVRGDTNADAGAMPEGHREGVNATDDVVREAGQNR